MPFPDNLHFIYNLSTITLYAKTVVNLDLLAVNTRIQNEVNFLVPESEATTTALHNYNHDDIE